MSEPVALRYEFDGYGYKYIELARAMEIDEED